MGVDLFFVLSGFLIGWQLLKPLAAGEPLRFGDFYLRRALRILPAFWVVLGLYMVWPPFREAEGMQPWWQFATFTENFLIDYFRNIAFSHAWSLCVEEHFYLLFPLLAWLLMQKPSAKQTLCVIALIVIGGMVLRGWVWSHELAPLRGIDEGEGNFWQRYIEKIYYPSYMRLDGLVAGAALAVIRVFRPTVWERAMQHANALLIAGLVGFAVSIWLFWERFAFVPTVIGFPLLSVSLALVVAASVSPQCALGRVRVPGAAVIAAIAYSTYLTHKQIFHLLKSAWGAPLQAHGFVSFFLYGFAALAAGAVLYWLVERPALRWREQVTLSARPPVAVVQ